MFNIVLVEPEIPHNTGACGRLAVATESTLHLVEPLGFSLDSRAIKRAGLDYWHHVDLVTWSSLEAFDLFLRKQERGGAHYLTTKGNSSIWPTSPKGDQIFNGGDFLIFGSETRGLPQSYLDRQQPEDLRRLPMSSSSPIRSLNLSTSVAITLYEALRQNRASVRFDEGIGG